MLSIWRSEYFDLDIWCPRFFVFEAQVNFNHEIIRDIFEAFNFLNSPKLVQNTELYVLKFMSLSLRS